MSSKNINSFKSEFPTIIRDFANHKEVIQGCSKKTVTEYLYDLRTFCRFLLSEKYNIPTDSEEFNNIDITCLTVDDFAAVTSSTILDFLFYVSSDRDNSARARARKLSAIKQFYKYCTTKKGLFDNNPAQNIETPKIEKTLPKYLTVNESLDLLESVVDNPISKTKERDYCIITLFLNCGIRLSELTGINTTDLDHSLESMRVTGKGNKQRIVYLNDACKSAISKYLPIRLKTPSKRKGETALFLSGQGNRISVKTVQWMVKKYLDEAGLTNKGYSTHKLRHTAATLMYQSGKVDIRVLKDILGHEQLNTTQIYTHVSNEHMQEAMENNPLSSVSADFDRMKPINDEEDEND